MSEQHLTRHFQFVTGSGEFLGCIQDKTRAKVKKRIKKRKNKHGNNVKCSLELLICLLKTPL